MMDKIDTRRIALEIEDSIYDAWIKTMQDHSDMYHPGNTPVTWDDLIKLLETISERIRRIGT